MNLEIFYYKEIRKKEKKKNYFKNNFQYFKIIYIKEQKNLMYLV